MHTVPPSRGRSQFGAILLFAAVTATPAAARQEIRGTVVDGASGTPVAGAMVVLLDSDDRSVGRVLTSADGLYRMPVEVPARYRLRVDRIGYASTRTAPFDVAADEVVRLDVTTTVRPVELPAVEAEGSRRCEVRPAHGVATNRVWQEARKALAAAEWTADRELYEFSGTRFRRTIAGNGRRVLNEQRTPVSRYTDQPFEARDATILARDGFVQPDAEGLVYFAPDASVLLSDAFLDTHCFTLDRRREDGVERIGLRFQPVPGRDLPEVAGVLWLDEDARLRSIEYRYVNLSPRFGGDHARGELTFRGLPNGTWIVQDWRIRMPELTADVNQYGDTVAYRVIGFRDDGGAVLSVRTATGDVVAGGVPGGVLTGTVRDSLGRPATGARVRVVGTAYETVTDADGAFRFPDVGEGTWTLEASHAALLAVGHTGSSIAVELARGDDRRVDLELPSVRSVALDRCRATPPERRHVVLVGRVIDENGVPAASADVRVLWTRWSTLPGGRVRGRDVGVGVETRQDGTYVFCQVPVDRTKRLSATAGESASDTLEVPPDSIVVAVPDLELRPQPVAPVASARAARRPSESGTALVLADSLWLDSKGFWLRGRDALLHRTLGEIAAQPRDTVLSQVVSRAPRIRALPFATGERQLRLHESADRRDGTGCEPDVYLNGSLVRRRDHIRRATPSRTRRALARPGERRRSASVTALTLDELIPLSSVTALEVFEASDAPVGDPGGCGAVLVWSRGAAHDDDPEFTGTLGGQVVCAAAGPLAGMKVDIEPGAIELVTDEQGRFVRDRLPPARYRVRVQVPEWGTWSTEVWLRAGSTAHVAAEVDGRCAIGAGRERLVDAGLAPQARSEYL